MGLFYVFLFPSSVIVGFFVYMFLFSEFCIRSLSYTETDRFGRKYRRKLFYAGRFCIGCGRRIITDIPKCPSCSRDFTEDCERTQPHLSEFCMRSLSYSEADRFGRRYRKKLFYAGRFCIGCGRRIITDIPKCLSCGRRFSVDSEKTQVHQSNNI